MSADRIRRLADVHIPHVYEAGQCVYYQDNPALAVHCIHQGRIKLSRLTTGGSEHVIGTRGAGQIFGCRAVLSHRPYYVSAEPLERSVVCTIPRDVFLQLMEEDARLALAVTARLASDSLATEEHLVALTCDPVRTRLARFLVEQMSTDDRTSKGAPVIPIELKHEVIAHLIGTTPETFSRTLHALAERGILDLHRHTIRVLDVGTLERIAGRDPTRSGSPHLA